MKFIDASRAMLAALWRKPDTGLPYSPDWEGLARDWAALNHEQEVQLIAQKAAYDSAVAIAGAQAEEQAARIAELEHKYERVEANYKRATDSWFEEKRKHETVQGNYQALLESTQLEHGRAEVDAATISRLEKEKWELVEVLAGRERAMKALSEEHGRVLAAKQLALEVQQSQSEVIATQHQGLLDYERDMRQVKEEMAGLETRLNQDHETIVELRGELSRTLETLALQTTEMEKGTETLSRLNAKSKELIEQYESLKDLASRALSLLLHPIGLHQPWPRKRDELAAEMKEAGITEPKPENG